MLQHSSYFHIKHLEDQRPTRSKVLIPMGISGYHLHRLAICQVSPTPAVVECASTAQRAARQVGDNEMETLKHY
jgi:hypothetical protein